MPKEECMWPFGKYKAFPCALNHLTLEMKMCQKKKKKKKEITMRKQLLELPHKMQRYTDESTIHG